MGSKYTTDHCPDFHTDINIKENNMEIDNLLLFNLTFKIQCRIIKTIDATILLNKMQNMYPI